MRWPSGRTRPWTDLEAILRTAGLPLFSVDTHRPAADFDVLAFNLSAELVFTNVLNCIDLAGYPVRAADRHGDAPLVVAGGHCTSNPEPLADFVDAFVIGDGEEVVGAMTPVITEWKAGPQRDVDREGVLRALAGIEGVYVPSLYDVTYDGPALVSVQPRFPDVPALVEKATIADLAQWPYPKNQLVPLTEVVHDRLNVEVFRGCTRGCRFCQAGMITRPVRERPAEQVRSMIDRGLRRTGYDEVALTSLSTADFSGIEEVVDATVSATDDGDGVDCSRVSVALPSLRVDAFTVGIAASIQTGPTHRPHLRSRGRHVAHAPGHQQADQRGRPVRRGRIRLFAGLAADEALLPHRTPHRDRRGHAGHRRAGPQLRRAGRGHHKNPSVTVSLGGFVPKPFTPFQWFGQNTEAELRRKIGLLRDDLRRDRGVQFKWHDPKATLIEGLLSRGDRRLGAVIEDVWRRGGTFQEWSEHFDRDLWVEATERAGLSMDWYIHRHRTEDEVLPWDHLSVGLHKDFLWQDWRDALDEVGLEDCRWTPCYDCGACTGYGIEHIVASAVPPAGGSQGTGQDLIGPGHPVPVGIRATAGASS